MATKPTILIVEQQANQREAMMRVLRMEQFNVYGAESPNKALAHLQNGIDLVLSDSRLGDASGIELLRLWKQNRPKTPFILVTAADEVNSAAEMMKLGADDCLFKPVKPAELLLLVAKSLKEREKAEQVEELESRLDSRTDQRLGFEKIAGKSRSMLEVFELARRAALSDSTVLITGESGTGKELFAEAIHQNSPRRDAPFITVNMAAVPENLVESELFGHVKGSFTGATESRIGRFEAADGGTLFIDEIGDFAPSSQAKLLRVLENHIITPVGSNENRAIDVRVVAATSRNLDEMVARQEFRQDLYYRLNVVNLRLPPLRHRREDIPILMDCFLDQLAASNGRRPLGVEPELLDALQRFDWPGNVRQLANCLESMVVLAADDTLRLEDLPNCFRHESNGAPDIDIPPGTSLEELERVAVKKTLDRHHGNRTHAAATLGISVRTLQRKLKAWGVNNGHKNGHKNQNGLSRALIGAATPA